MNAIVTGASATYWRWRLYRECLAVERALRVARTFARSWRDYVRFLEQDLER